jgi:hypothetical protein
MNAMEISTQFGSVAIIVGAVAISTLIHHYDQKILDIIVSLLPGEEDPVYRIVIDCPSYPRISSEESLPQS